MVKTNQPVTKLIAAGKQKRGQVSFAELGTFHPTKRNAMQMIQTTEKKLIPELVPIRNERMSKSAFAFYRGSLELMDYDLNQQPATGIQVVICGDAHISNFGFFASPERQLLFDLNDFDESDIGNWEWDLKRLVVSVILSSDHLKLAPHKLQKLLLKTVASYRLGLKKEFDESVLQRYYPANDVTDVVRSLPKKKNDPDLINDIVAKAQKRTSEQVVQKLTTVDTNGNRRFIDKPPISEHVSNQTYQSLTTHFNAYKQTVHADVALLLSQYSVTDAIRHTVGVGSVGTDSFLILLTGLDGSHLVLQVKEAVVPKLAEYSDENSPAMQLKDISQGERIVDCQRILQSVSDPLLGYYTANDKDYYVRQYRDMKESVNPEELDEQQFKTYAKVCAWILSVAHAQSPTAAMIRGYVGHAAKFDEAIVNWSLAYAKQVEKDYQNFLNTQKISTNK
ncbi:hypothetical protein IV38_GL001113 [Lactobacillus selangorensis]|uniref:DUF2252 domain-containing protein n=1 Tax=Lactobacillus selangorensis TaxID=81857 RepID=A0A0R2G7Q3_9LACO|nr:DUF2252 domain-containing protein [Lactobacillus selangorensis]KRN28905.1 hypothetical protein IV38_GL001113 [Lactobacillus selangorensis]KRN32685.1 hypothetical protein IV40_GL000740 [Lactobacillus selangorensis]